MTSHSLSGKRILICRSNPVAPDPRVEKVAQSLIRNGSQVKVIAWDRTEKLPEQEQRKGMCIERIPIRAGYARGLMNIFPLLRWQFLLFWWVLTHRAQYDIIHACDFDTVLPALCMKFLFNKRLIYDIFDFYADHLRATPGWIKEWIRFLDLKVIGRADAVILVDDARIEQIKGSHPQRLSVIYNSPRDIQIGSQGREDYREGGFSIVYVGLLQVERGLFELLEVMKNHPDWKLELAGFGGDREKMLKMIEEFENVRWHGRIPYPETLRLTASCDVSIATYDPNIPNHRYASPNKIFEAMMLSNPVIVAKNTNMDRIISRWDCGLIVEYGNEALLEKALQSLAEKPLWREELGKNGRQAYERAYSWKTMEARLIDLYQDVLDG